GKREDVLIHLLGIDGSDYVPHTLFCAARPATSSMKKWLAHSEDFAKGSVTVNEGAAQALTARAGVSLLPVGVTSIEGHFDKDDIIQVHDPEGQTIAWGRAACGSETARAWIERAERRPLIHADYLFTELNY
ncbi:MAG: glutamate 5-kinase, partial [Muribaculum sp.]|nr:glutamate 5-kinase [Muribaculum sp.]